MMLSAITIIVLTAFLGGAIVGLVTGLRLGKSKPKSHDTKGQIPPFFHS